MSFISKFQEEKISNTHKEKVSDYLVLNPDFSNRSILNVVETAVKEGKKIVLQSIPNEKISRKLLRYVSVAIFDEFQLSVVTKVKTDSLFNVKNAMLRLYGKGVDVIIVKMSNGRAMIFEEETFSSLDLIEEDLDSMLELFKI